MYLIECSQSGQTYDVAPATLDCGVLKCPSFTLPAGATAEANCNSGVGIGASCKVSCGSDYTKAGDTTLNW